MAAGEKTEKATPKRRQDARRKGQVARSADLNGSVVLLAGLLALGAFGPALVERARDAMRASLLQIARPEAVSVGGIGDLMTAAGGAVAAAVAPIALACLVAGVAVNVAQVGFRPTPAALRPDWRRLNPIQGLKNILGPHALVEGAKAVSKTGLVAAVAALVVAPRIESMAGLVGAGPDELAAELASTVGAVARWGALAYLAIGVADVVYQRRRHERTLRMDRQELREEHKQQSLPPEVRAAIRRRQLQQARARMMAAVPQADVVVVNPTHFAVALRYQGGMAAPEVVAKGQDLVAARIREIAAEAGVPVVSDPPLARSLHATVEVGREIPEQLYQAVAQLLAFVYRMAARRRLAA